MKFEYLREFVTVAQSTQMFDAAQALGISFSSLSKHMKALEMELGVPLFMRARKVVLTQYGRTMLNYAQELVVLQDQYLLDFQKMMNPNVELTIGISQFQYRGNIDELIDRYQQSDSSLSFLMKEARNTDLPVLVLNGSCDIAFVRSMSSLSRMKGLAYFPYCMDRLVACVPASHPCAKQKSVSFGDLKDETIFLRSENSMIHNILAEKYAALGVLPKVSTCGFYASFDNIRKGNGITYYMAPPPEADFGDAIVTIPVDPPVYTYVDIVARAGHITPSVESFLQFVWHSYPKISSSDTF